ncbi:hypothetical protein [Bifidobacterium dentium]|uniref:hypothetical protein n=1 Tax=Bifidobacterium dentium TaxID=1689 RepID=UPI0014952908|nr:hypothetical protein [Bifidobacterium dentium]
MLQAMPAFLQCTRWKGRRPKIQLHAISMVQPLEHQYDVIQCAGIIVEHTDAYAANVRIPLSAMVAVYRVVRGASVGRFVVQRFLQLSADDLWLPMQFLYSGFRKALGFARHRRRKVPMMKSLRMSRMMRCCVAILAAVASMCCFAAPAWLTIMAIPHGVRT